jgi:hypothetical protein
VAAPIEAGQRHEQEIGVDDGGFLDRLANGHRACASRLSGPPEAKSKSRSSANDDRQRGCESFAGERCQKQERVRLIADGVKDRNDRRAPEPREPQTFLGEALSKSNAGRSVSLPSPGESVAAQEGFRIGLV